MHFSKHASKIGEMSLWKIIKNNKNSNKVALAIASSKNAHCTNKIY